MSGFTQFSQEAGTFLSLSTKAWYGFMGYLGSYGAAALWECVRVGSPWSMPCRSFGGPGDAGLLRLHRQVTLPV